MQKKYLVILAIAACVVAVLAQSDDPRPIDLQQNTTVSQPQASPVRLVEVINFPDPQNVAGTVNVGNLPSTQQVAGSVAVSNLPAVQQVEVVNLPPSSQARFQLVGFSTQAFDGGQGIFTYTLACQTDFPGSRMCTSVEAVETVEVPVLPVGAAWIRPIVAGGGKEAVYHATAGGTYSINCEGWRVTSQAYGLLVDRAGRFSQGYCPTAYPVACCAPVE